MKLPAFVMISIEKAPLSIQSRFAPQKRRLTCPAIGLRIVMLTFELRSEARDYQHES